MSSKTRIWLFAAVAIAIAVRIAWALTHSFCIEQEGAEYARIAQNLLAGRGYQGIFANGTQLNFPPLFPLAIAAVSPLVGDFEIAARLVNIVLGGLLVLAMFQLADALFGRKAAIGAAVMTVFYPVFLAGSASTYSENTYLTPIMFAFLMVLRWIQRRQAKYAVFAGLLFGAAYLIRPEAFLLAGASAAAGLVFAPFTATPRRTVLSAALLLLAFVVVAAPNIYFLTQETGKLRLEAKGTLAYEWGSRISRGMSYAESANAIGPDLSDQGVFMRPNLDVINSASFSMLDYATFVAKAARKNIPRVVYAIIGERGTGTPLLLLLALIGVFGSRWTAERLRTEGTIFLFAVSFGVMLLTVQELWFRYFYGIFGMMLLWAAKGADDLRIWCTNAVAKFAPAASTAARIGDGVKWLTLAGVLALSASQVAEIDQFRESSHAARKTAGLWLSQQQPKAARTMGYEVQVAFYAGADMAYLPYSDSDLALRYITKKRPDYIVLIGGSSGGLPYIKEWFARGIPSADAELVYDRVAPGDEHIKIYRWRTAPVAAVEANKRPAQS